MARAYSQLSTTRSVGMDGIIGPIPVTAIWEYCDRTGISADPVLREHFVDVMRAIDQHTLNTAAARRRQRTGG
jgi:hypothetical protein